MSKYEAKWSGSYPCLCSGEWILFVDGKICEVEIPFQGSPADTQGVYSEWHFENWMEVFEDYEEGMYCDDWCGTYADYLSQVAPREDWEKIFKAFQAKDWRHGSCGGCI